MLPIILASFAAFLAGFVDAIAGGGGVITFPTLLMLGLPVNLIVGTNKLVSSCGTLMASYTFWKKGAITKELLSFALPFTCLFALIGACKVLNVPNEFLKPVASILVFCLALYLCFRPNLGQTSTYTGLTRELKVILALGCGLLGFYDGFFGPGTGMFLSYLMVRFMGLDFTRATGNTKILNLASNLVPLGYFLTQGNILYQYGIPMAAANIAGGYIGANSAIKGGAKLIRKISIVMATTLALKMAYDYLGH